MKQKKIALMDNLDFELLKQLLEVLAGTINVINVFSARKKKKKRKNKD